MEPAESPADVDPSMLNETAGTRVMTEVEVRSFDASRMSMEQVFLKVYGHAPGEGVAA